MPRTGGSGADEAAGAAAPRTRSSRDQWRWMLRTGTSGAEQAAGAVAPRTGIYGDKWQPDAPDGRNRDRTRSRGCHPQKWIIWGQAAAERHRLDHPGRIKQQEPPHPGLDHPGTSGGQTRRTSAIGTEQGAGAAVSRNGSSGDKRWPNATDCIIQGRIKQQEPPHPRFDHPGTSGGRTPRTGSSGAHQSAGAAAPRTGSSGDKGRSDAADRKQPRGRGQGEAVDQRRGGARGDAVMK